MIRAHGLHKTFKTGFWIWRREVSVLRGFDFEARPGEVTGVLGPNGAGKTTFFRILCGLEKPCSGEIEVDGINPWRQPEQMRGRIALLPEDPGVSQNMAGYRHLWLFGAMMGMDDAQIRTALSQADDILYLSAFWARPFSSYSRGQKARIALARMRLMPDASVLIFDEPSNGLDFEAVSRLHLFIRNLADEGKTILVASHILADLRHLCDRLVGISGGTAASHEVLSGWLAAHALSQSQRTPSETPALA